MNTYKKIDTGNYNKVIRIVRELLLFGNKLSVKPLVTPYEL